MVHTRPAAHLEAYRFLERSHLPTLIVSLQHPAANLQALLRRQGTSTHNVMFMDTVSKRSDAELLPNADYLFNPDLSELGKRMVQQLHNHPGEKIVVLDAASTLRHWYSQPVVSSFIGALQSCLRDVNTHLVVLNEESLPALPNVRFDQVVQV